MFMGRVASSLHLTVYRRSSQNSNWINELGSTQVKTTMFPFQWCVWQREENSSCLSLETFLVIPLPACSSGQVRVLWNCLSSSTCFYHRVAGIEIFFPYCLIPWCRQREVWKEDHSDLLYKLCYFCYSLRKCQVSTLYILNITTSQMLTLCACPFLYLTFVGWSLLLKLLTQNSN